MQQIRPHVKEPIAPATHRRADCVDQTPRSRLRRPQAKELTAPTTRRGADYANQTPKV